MTDTELVKILNKLIHLGDTPIGKDYGVIIDNQTLWETLDLINRLKAELDESREKNAGLALALLHEVVNEDEQLRNEITKVAKSEARKEFAEFLKARKIIADTSNYYGKECITEVITVEDIDTLLKEMG